MKLPGVEKDISSEVNLNALAKSIYQESIEMKFTSNDYVKLMNEILEMTITNSEKTIQTNSDSDSTFVSKDLPIESKNLKLRYYDPKKDKKYLEKWFEGDNNNLFLLSTTSRDDLELEKISTDDKNVFATITLKNDTPIGLLALLNIDSRNKKAEMRKMIGDITERGKGYGKEATKLWLKYCTQYLDIKKIYINTIEANIRNISINRQLGFKIEGLLKKDCIIDNIEHDVLRMAYIREEAK